MTLQEAREARSKLSDVFTAEGDAGVIETLRIKADRGMCAKVVGRNVNDWIPIAELTQ